MDICFSFAQQSQASPTSSTRTKVELDLVRDSEDEHAKVQKPQRKKQKNEDSKKEDSEYDYIKDYFGKAFHGKQDVSTLFSFVYPFISFSFLNFAVFSSSLMLPSLTFASRDPMVQKGLFLASGVAKKSGVPAVQHPIYIRIAMAPSSSENQVNPGVRNDLLRLQTAAISRSPLLNSARLKRQVNQRAARLLLPPTHRRSHGLITVCLIRCSDSGSFEGPSHGDVSKTPS